MNAALKRLGFSGEEHCPHGFRATASTFLNASNRFSADAVEHSLAHRDKDVSGGLMREATLCQSACLWLNGGQTTLTS